MGRFTSALPERIAAYGVRVRLVSGWESRGAATFSPKGVVGHHDALPPGISAASAVNLMVQGRPDLSGPLCNVWLDDDDDYTPGVAGDPVAYVIASGRANHAGAGGYRGLTGNTSVGGIEARNRGNGEVWSASMLDAYYRVSAAMLDVIGRDASWWCGHKEWAPTRKIDPYPIDCDRFRGLTFIHQIAMAKGPTPSPQPPLPDPGPTPPPVYATTMEGGMLRLIRNPHNTTEIWLTNGMERRHVTTLDEANWWKWQIALATPVDTRDAVTASVEANVPVSVFDSMKVVA